MHLSRVIFVGAVLMSGCTPVQEGQVNAEDRAEVVQQLSFLKLGQVVGEACVAKLSGKPGAEALLEKIGLVRNPKSGSFAMPIAGGKKAFIGQKDMGRLYVNPAMSQTGLFGPRTACTVTLGGFSKEAGDAFFSAFRGAASKASALKVHGHYAHGAAQMSMEIRP